jgi:hypothetical protein
MAAKVSQLSSGLIARKGGATPAAPGPVSQQPVSQQSPEPKPKGTAGTIAVTVRLDPERYEKLKMFGVKNRRTNQDILVGALDSYLS